MQSFTPLQYLKIDIANCYGLDRKTWDDRLEWVAINEPLLENHDIDAKSPILYRKAVRALRDVAADRPVNHVMGLDATASGLQILACVSGCETTARAVNLIDTGDREDVYEHMSDYMNTQGCSLDRNKMKRPLMTTMYGSTAQPIKIFGEATRELMLYYEALKKRLTGAYAAMQFIQKHWDPTAGYYRWVMPDGHQVHIPVTDVMMKKIEIEELNNPKVKYGNATFKYMSHVIMPQKKGRSLAANVVHSIDAWICREMVLKAKQQKFWLAPIHDCFFTSPKYMEQVRINYLELMLEVSEDNLLNNILSQIKGSPAGYTKIQSNLSSYIPTANYALS